MSYRKTFKYDIPTEHKNSSPLVVAIDQYKRTKSGIIIVISKIGCSKDTELRTYENQYFYYFENNETQDMLNIMIEEFNISKQNGYEIFAYRYVKDLSKQYSCSGSELNNIAMRVELFTKELIASIDSAKRIKELL